MTIQSTLGQHFVHLNGELISPHEATALPIKNGTQWPETRHVCAIKRRERQQEVV
jgi:hypothetical protein